MKTWWDFALSAQQKKSFCTKRIEFSKKNSKLITSWKTKKPLFARRPKCSVFFFSLWSFTLFWSFQLIFTERKRWKNIFLQQRTSIFQLVFIMINEFRWTLIEIESQHDSSIINLKISLGLTKFSITLKNCFWRWILNGLFSLRKLSNNGTTSWSLYQNDVKVKNVTNFYYWWDISSKAVGNELAVCFCVDCVTV